MQNLQIMTDQIVDDIPHFSANRIDQLYTYHVRYSKIVRICIGHYRFFIFLDLHLEKDFILVVKVQ